MYKNSCAVIPDNIIPPESSVVVGFSGGPDSVFLLHYLVELRAQGSVKSISAAHLDHEWRSDSDADAQWCAQMCATLDVPFVQEKISAFSQEVQPNGSQEAYARKARRLFFERVREQHNADYIVLGHHLQDQEETFFIRLIRGSSLSGLTCMWPRKGHYLRPLLRTSKTTILAYLDAHAIPYLTDPTNQSPDFLRNRIRAEVLPAIRSADNRFDLNFLSTLDRLQETELLLSDLTQSTLETIATDRGLSIEQFLAQPSALRYRLLVAWLCNANVSFPISTGFFNEIIRFFKKPGSSVHTIHPTLKIRKEKSYAHIDSA